MPPPDIGCRGQDAKDYQAEPEVHHQSEVNLEWDVARGRRKVGHEKVVGRISHKNRYQRAQKVRHSLLDTASRLQEARFLQGWIDYGRLSGLASTVCQAPNVKS